MYIVLMYDTHILKMNDDVKQFIDLFQRFLTNKTIKIFCKISSLNRA